MNYHENFSSNAILLDKYCWRLKSSLRATEDLVARMEEPTRCHSRVGGNPVKKV
ncbi:MAG TPA: hypothetical protein LFV92_06150 [Rickettsia endosymbiont of Ceroptres masudai]|nr:hypothetical protein [Rickettsia endosymbiont of Ceroptres masudai]